MVKQIGQWLTKSGGKTTAVAFALLILVCLLVLSDTAMGQKEISGTTAKTGAESKESQPQAGDNKTEKKTEFEVPDVAVLDQNGRKLQFYTDLVKGRTVVINFVYTTCRGVCPIAGENFAKLQARLGKRLGEDVFMISVTTDPEVDSPARLKAWSKKYHPARGWTLVTGTKDDITKLLLTLTGSGTKTGGYHVPNICVIDDVKKTQKWNYGILAPDEIVGMVDQK